MNRLSWVLYLSDVAPMLRGFLFVLAGTAFALGVGAAAMGGYLRAEGDDDAAVYTLQRTRNYGWGVFLVASLLAVLTPGRGTVLAIAASETSEIIYNNIKATGVIDPTVELLRKKIEAALAAEGHKIKEKPRSSD